MEPSPGRGGQDESNTTESRLKPQSLCTLPIFSTSLHSLFDNPYSLSIGHVNLSLCPVGREMSIIYDRDCLQSALSASSERMTYTTRSVWRYW